MDLYLPLKTKWFDMTSPEEKSEDYREINEYWYKRLVDRDSMRSIKKFSLAFIIEMAKDQKDVPFGYWENANDAFKGCYKKFDNNIMTLGYPSKTDTSRVKKFKHAGIEIGTGKQEWGAEPNKYYFIIKHGELVK